MSELKDELDLLEVRSGHPTVIVRPGDQLTPAQAVRVARAVAILNAKMALLEAGVLPEHLNRYSFVAHVYLDDAAVDVDPADREEQ